jgi:hypothetical protein
MLIAILVSIVASVILFFLLPFLAKPRDKFLEWAFKKRKIRTRIEKDLKILETIEQPLLFINQLPHFPDEAKTEKLLIALEEIRSKALLIKSAHFEGIKRTLLSYSDKANQLHSNMSLKEKLNLLVNNNQAFGLVEEIRTIIREGLNKNKA